MKIDLTNIRIQTERTVPFVDETTKAIDDNGHITPTIFLGISAIGLFITSKAIATYTYFGLLTLGGFIAITESIKPIKKVVKNNKNTVDVLIFTGTLYAILTAGVTIAATLTIAGLGYTLVYKPYLNK